MRMRMVMRMVMRMTRRFHTVHRERHRDDASSRRQVSDTPWRVRAESRGVCCFRVCKPYTIHSGQLVAPPIPARRRTLEGVIGGDGVGRFAIKTQLESVTACDWIERVEFDEQYSLVTSTDPDRAGRYYYRHLLVPLATIQRCHSHQQFHDPRHRENFALSTHSDIMEKSWCQLPLDRTTGVQKAYPYYSPVAATAADVAAAGLGRSDCLTGTRWNQ